MQCDRADAGIQYSRATGLRLYSVVNQCDSRSSAGLLDRRVQVKQYQGKAVARVRKNQ